MNKYESVLLDKMVEERSGARRSDMSRDQRDEHVRMVMTLLDCICDFREPPRELAVEEGCGALVDAKG